MKNENALTEAIRFYVFAAMALMMGVVPARGEDPNAWKKSFSGARCLQRMDALAQKAADAKAAAAKGNVAPIAGPTTPVVEAITPWSGDPTDTAGEQRYYELQAAAAFKRADAAGKIVAEKIASSRKNIALAREKIALAKEKIASARQKIDISRQKTDDYRALISTNSSVPESVVKPVVGGTCPEDKCVAEAADSSHMLLCGQRNNGPFQWIEVPYSEADPPACGDPNCVLASACATTTETPPKKPKNPPTTPKQTPPKQTPPKQTPPKQTPPTKEPMPLQKLLPKKSLLPFTGGGGKSAPMD